MNLIIRPALKSLRYAIIIIIIDIVVAVKIISVAYNLPGAGKGPRLHYALCDGETKLREGQRPGQGPGGSQSRCKNKNPGPHWPLSQSSLLSVRPGSLGETRKPLLWATHWFF